jgi:hypothetical protein
LNQTHKLLLLTKWRDKDSLQPRSSARRTHCEECPYTIEEYYTDNGKEYRGDPKHPKTNGKGDSPGMADAELAFGYVKDTKNNRVCQGDFTRGFYLLIIIQ